MLFRVDPRDLMHGAWRCLDRSLGRSIVCAVVVVETSTETRQTVRQTGSEFSAANMLAQSSALIHPSSEFMHSHADRMHANFIFISFWLAIKLAHSGLTRLN